MRKAIYRLVGCIVLFFFTAGPVVGQDGASLYKLLCATCHGDAFMAFDLDTGKVLWSRQMTAADAWNTACRLSDKTNGK